MSEFGCGSKDTFIDSLTLAKHIFRDLETLQPQAWIYWQVENSNSGNWGILQVDFTNPSTVFIKKQYYILKHFTKTLKNGDNYKILHQNSLQILHIQNTKEIKYIIFNNTNTTQSIPCFYGTQSIIQSTPLFLYKNITYNSNTNILIPSFSLTSIITHPTSK
jgi:hypothetical protein